jgi:small subunit ribosomal protein S17
MTQAQRRKRMVGTVVSDKMQKTVVVQVEKLLPHKKYKKYVRVKRKYKAHDEEQKCRVGDRVVIVETRPLSKEKRWVVKEVLGKEEVPLLEEEMRDDTGEIET